MSGESFCSLHVVAFALRNDNNSKSKGSPFVHFVLMHSPIGTNFDNSFQAVSARFRSFQLVLTYINYGISLPL